MTFAAAIVDMDGLLFDTERLYAEATALALQDIGYAPSVDLCESLAGFPHDACDSLILAHFGAGFPLGALSDAYERRKAAVLGGGPPLKPGAVEFVSHLRSAGLRVALATGAVRAVMTDYLERVRMRGLFDATITRDDISCGKPAPDTYLVASAKLGTAPSRCLAFEDSAPGVESANAAGVPVVVVPDIAAIPNETLDGCRAVVPDLYAAIRYLRTTLRKSSTVIASTSCDDD